ncbi:cytochrome p450 [Diplodia corticola]|uniref:Cytochrome p450 n=1 Tax=Diplodia corticola TaxID=236234 RepID=A0A1J9QNK7_9PEZI|nr:cytochrome p450 [Diplodia corticola]OJD30040.1 cytochrome p450 [Diplodia corticola]
MDEIQPAELSRGLQIGLLSSCSKSFALGVLFHWSIVRVEIDGQGWRLVGVYLASVMFLWALFALLGHMHALEAAFRTACVANSFKLGLAASILAYRLLFHSLRKFPGPKYAAASRFYAMFLACKNTQYSDEVEKLHKQYGDFVRIGPREISINRPAAIRLIYGPPSRCKKSPWYSQVTEDVTKCSINSTRVLEVQRQRRRAWDRGFSIKALSNYEPRVKAKMDTLIQQLRRLSEAKAPVNGTAWSMFFSFDVMGEVGLGRDFKTLEAGKEHPTIKGIHDSMAAIGLLTPVPWLLRMAAAVPGAASSLTAFMTYCSQQVREKEKEVHSDADPQDILSWLIKARFEHDKSAPPGEMALHEDARLLIIAGSDTTAAALANTLNFFVRHPRVLAKLQSQLDAAFPRGDDGSLSSSAIAKSVPYLDDIIHETLRLRPPVPSGLARVTPPEGLVVDGVHIPGDTIVSVPTQALQRDERNFERAAEFRPERWSEEGPPLNPETAAFIAFSRGAMNCAGKQLAKMELRMFLARVALNFDVGYAEGETGEVFERGQLDTFTLTLPPLMLSFTPRHSAGA